MVQPKPTQIGFKLNNFISTNTSIAELSEALCPGVEGEGGNRTKNNFTHYQNLLHNN